MWVRLTLMRGGSKSGQRRAPRYRDCVRKPYRRPTIDVSDSFERLALACTGAAPRGCPPGQVRLTGSRKGRGCGFWFAECAQVTSS